MVESKDLSGICIENAHTYMQPKSMLQTPSPVTGAIILTLAKYTYYLIQATFSQTVSFWTCVFAKREPDR